MNILSVEIENEDIIEYVVRQFDTNIRQKLKTKIYYTIKLSINDNQISNSHRVKNLKGSVSEFRISIPDTKNLLRIIFCYENGELILLTGYIIKPENYNDKKHTVQIKKEYIENINKAEEILKDYKGAQKLNYIPIKII